MSISIEMAAAIRKCEGKKHGGSRYKGIHGEGRFCCSELGRVFNSLVCSQALGTVTRLMEERALLKYVESVSICLKKSEIIEECSNSATHKKCIGFLLYIESTLKLIYW